MAAETLAAVAGAFAQTMAPEITRVWNRQANLLRLIPVTEYRGQGSGIAISWDVEGDGAGAASFAEGSDVGAGELLEDPVSKAYLAWGMYRSAFQLSNLEIAAAAANVGNATALEDMVGERFIGSLTKIISAMNVDCFSGTGTDGSGNPNIIGLDAAIAASGLYANLNPATTGFTNWKATVNSNSSTARPLTLSVMAATEQGIFTLSGMDPDIVIATAGVHTKYEGLFEAVRRTVDSGQGPIPSYQGSTGRLYWRGRPIVRDKDATTGTMYMLRSDEIALRVLPWGAFPSTVPYERRMGMAGNGKDQEQMPIPFYRYPLARTGSAVKFCVETYAQLQLTRRSAHARIIDISES